MAKETEKIMCMNGPCYLDGMTPAEVHEELLKMIAKMPQDEPAPPEANHGTPTT